jgi:hypothetical protein
MSVNTLFAGVNNAFAGANELMTSANNVFVDVTGKPLIAAWLEVAVELVRSRPELGCGHGSLLSNAEKSRLVGGFFLCLPISSVYHIEAIHTPKYFEGIVV